MNRETMVTLGYRYVTSVREDEIHLTWKGADGNPMTKTFCGLPCATYPYSPWFVTTDEPTCEACVKAANE